jgi:ATP-dependent DNA helicase PIF1
MSSVVGGSGGLFFVYGYGGTGKTFLCKTLSAGLRSQKFIVLNVASSGIASLLFPKGRTAHSMFSIPLVIHEASSCNIDKQSPRGKLLLHTKLIIWDEAPMMNRFCFEALDRTLRDIMSSQDENNKDKPFGGKVVVLGGDFRQILSVIRKANREDIVSSAVNSSKVWDTCKVLKLTKNMRL